MFDDIFAVIIAKLVIAIILTVVAWVAALHGVGLRTFFFDRGPKKVLIAVGVTCSIWIVAMLF